MQNRAKERQLHPHPLVVLALALAFSIPAGSSAWAGVQGIEPPVHVTGELNGEQQALPFFATAGARLRVKVSTAGPVIAEVTVYGPDGKASTDHSRQSCDTAWWKPPGP